MLTSFNDVGATGSGTFDDPYGGEETVFIQLDPLGERNVELYIEVGTDVIITYGSGTAMTGIEGDDIGLELTHVGSSNGYAGIIDSIGTATVHAQSARYNYTITIHALEYSYSASLVFQSDPVTNGTLIPPGHHLVTFNDSYGVMDTYWIIVEDGYILTKYDDPDWSDAVPRPYRIGSADGEDLTSYEVHGNVTVYYGSYDGGWPDDGDGSGGSSGQD